MNAERFMELMNTLPDDMIVTAVHAEYRRRPKLMRFLPAIAACLVIGIFAAVYPKLRMQTPEITEPPAATVTAETTAQTAAETTAVTVYTTAVSMKTTHRTTAETVSQTAAETVTDAEAVTDAVTEQEQVLTVPETPIQPETAPPPVTTAILTVTAETTEAPIQDAPESFHVDAPEEPTFTLPVITGPWQKENSAPSDWPEPYIRFYFVRSTPDDRGYMLDSRYDPAHQQYIVVKVWADYTDAALCGGTMTPSGLQLHFVCLRPPDSTVILYYAIPLPDGYDILPEDCRAEYTVVNDSDIFQEKQTDQPMIDVYA